MTDERTDDETTAPIGWPLVALGLGLWLLAGIDLLANALFRHEVGWDVPTLLVTTTFTAFGVAHALALRLAGTIPPPRMLALIAAQFFFTMLDLDLTVLLLLEIPLVLPMPTSRRVGIAVLAITALRVGLDIATTPEAVPEHRRAISIAYGVALEVVRIALIQGAALVGGLALADERRARHALARVNRELAATRAALAAKERAEERARLGLELHDHLGHHLVALGQKLELATARPGDAMPVTSARELVAKMLGDVRAMLRSGRQDEPSGTLRERLAALATVFEGVHTEVEVEEGADELDAALATAIVRIAQEAITNAVRHGAAKRLRVTVRGGSSAELVVSDDGTGVLERPEGMGIAGMRARAERLGGEVVIEAAPGRGTTIRASFS